MFARPGSYRFGRTYTALPSEVLPLCVQEEATVAVAPTMSLNVYRKPPDPSSSLTPSWPSGRYTKFVSAVELGPVATLPPIKMSQQSAPPMRLALNDVFP